MKYSCKFICPVEKSRVTYISLSSVSQIKISSAEIYFSFFDKPCVALSFYDFVKDLDRDAKREAIQILNTEARIEVFKFLDSDDSVSVLDLGMLKGKLSGCFQEWLIYGKKNNDVD